MDGPQDVENLSIIKPCVERKKKKKKKRRQLGGPYPRSNNITCGTLKGN